MMTDSLYDFHMRDMKLLMNKALAKSGYSKNNMFLLGLQVSEIGEADRRRWWNAFETVCRAIVKTDAFQILLEFVEAVFETGLRQDVDFDLVTMHSVLNKILLHPRYRVEEEKISVINCTLADLCQDYLGNFYEPIGEWGSLFLIPYRRKGNYGNIHVRRQELLFQSVADLVYSDTEGETVKTPEALYTMTRCRSCPNIETCKGGPLLEALSGQKVKKAPKCPDEADYPLGFLGAWQARFLADASITPQMRNDILQQRVIPVLERVKWEKGDLVTDVLDVLAETLLGDFCACEYYDMVGMKMGFWKAKLTAEQEQWQERTGKELSTGGLQTFLAELQKGQFFLGDKECRQEKFAGCYGAIGEYLATFIEKRWDVVCREWHSHTKQYLLCVAVAMLYHSADHRNRMRAGRLLIAHYMELEESIRRDAGMIWYMCRCVLSAEAAQLPMANVLYGLFFADMNHDPESLHTHLQTVRDACKFLAQVKKQLAKEENTSYIDHHRWWDVLFDPDYDCSDFTGQAGAGFGAAFEANVAAILTRAEAGKLPEEARGRWLYLYLLALKDQKMRIVLPVKPTYCMDDGPWLPDKLDRECVMLVERMERLLVFCKRRNEEDMRRLTGDLMQRHMAKLQDALVWETVEKLRKEKLALENLQDGMDEAQRQTRLQAMDAHIGELMERVNMSPMAGYLAKETLRRSYDAYRMRLGEQGELCRFDLFGQKPLENQVRRYLVAAEILFDRMTGLSLESGEKEFSGVVIAYTSALEAVLNLLYRRIQDRIDPGQDAFKNFIRDRRPVDHVEIGKFAHLLKDNVKDRRISLFELVELQRHLDIELLSQPPLTGNAGFALRTGFGSRPCSFGADAEVNRYLLADILQHVADGYRNPAAHSGAIDQQKAADLRELLIGRGSLLWILLTLMKE